MTDGIDELRHQFDALVARRTDARRLELTAMRTKDEARARELLGVARRFEEYSASWRRTLIQILLIIESVVTPALIFTLTLLWLTGNTHIATVVMMLFGTFFATVLTLAAAPVDVVEKEYSFLETFFSSVHEAPVITVATRSDRRRRRPE